MKKLRQVTTVAMSLFVWQITLADQATEPAPTQLPKMIVNDTADTEYDAPNATTAMKTDTPIMETPLNVQVITQQVLQDQQVIRIDHG